MTNKTPKIIKVCKHHGELVRKQVAVSKSGVTICKICRNERVRKYYEKNKGKRQIDSWTWVLNNSKRRQTYARAWWQLKKGNPAPMKQYKQKYAKH